MSSDTPAPVYVYTAHLWYGVQKREVLCIYDIWTITNSSPPEVFKTEDLHRTRDAAVKAYQASIIRDMNVLQTKLNASLEEQ